MACNRLLSSSDIDAVLANDMAELSVTERQTIVEEIDGLAEKVMDETPEYVEECLKQLKTKLEEMRKGTSSDLAAYDLAMSANPTYVKNKEFRLMFLRAERGDANKAAVRMVRHFQYKLELFGEELIGKHSLAN